MLLTYPSAKATMVNLKITFDVDYRRKIASLYGFKKKCTKRKKLADKIADTLDINSN